MPCNQACETIRLSTQRHNGPHENSWCNFSCPWKAPEGTAKKKAKKRTGFSKRPGDASGEGNSERSNKTILATCTKEQLQFSGLALYCQCLFPFLSLGLFVDLTCMQFPPSPPSKVSVRGGSANRPWLLYQPDSLVFICRSS